MPLLQALLPVIRFGVKIEVSGLELSLGTAIRPIRREKKLLASELSNMSNISAGMLSKIENGKITASLRTLRSIAAALDVPLASLFLNFDEHSPR